MLWITLGVLSPLLLSSEFILESFLINSKLKDSFIYANFISACRFLWLLLLFFVPLVVPEGRYLLFAIGSSVAFFIGLLLYYHAISVEEVSRIIPLTYVTPVILLFLGVIFLKEKLAINQYLSIALLLTGAVLITFKPEKSRMSKATFFMLPAMILFAISFFLTKLFLMKYSVFDYLIWVGSMTAFFACIVLIWKRQRVSLVAKRVDKRTALIFPLVVVFWVSSAITGNFATQLGPISIVTALGGIGAAYAFAATLLINKARPGTLNETGKNFFQKLIAVCLIVAGTIMLYF